MVVAEISLLVTIVISALESGPRPPPGGGWGGGGRAGGVWGG
jgi:hypothetical protein